jgi:chromosome segregation ATPase
MAWELVTMEPSNLSSAPSTTASLTAQHGVDMLWRYQLRKESAALLEKLDASERMIEDITSETTRKLRETAERISTLETKLDSIDNDGQKLREAKQKWDDDVAAMKARMGIVTESVIPESTSSCQTLKDSLLTTSPTYI